MSSWVFGLYYCMAIIGMSLVVWRLFRGPSNADRLNAADLFTIMGLGILLIGSIAAPPRYTMDVALVGSLMLFFGSSLVALVWRSKHLSGESIDDDNS